MSLSLFSTKPSESGYRLHTYEVLNWGTFDQEVWSIHPQCETSLLTGGNGSGKTTLVDGLLTLLVPEKRMRFYNQTAGSKGERTEETYVLGEYGESENAETDTREFEKLRPDKSKAQSILLAVFKSENQYVTLAQARWFSGSELKRTFVLAYKQLSIAQDFSPFDNSGQWKKRLKQKYTTQGNKNAIHFTDAPGEYGRIMRNVFGMLTPKAHTLFSQTIGLKVLGDLNAFVRTQMLEESDAESEFQKIKTHFKTLSDAHKAIEKAHRQIELLQPVREKYLVLNQLKADLEKEENHMSTAPFWFATKAIQLIDTFITERSQNVETISAKIKVMEEDIELTDQKRTDLEVDIKSDEVGRQIENLEKENKRHNTDKKDRESELKAYNKLARKLELNESPQSIENFDQQRQLAFTRKKEAQTTLKETEQKLRVQVIKEDGIQKEFNNVTNELNALRSQRNNIPAHQARIRNEIIKHLGASEEDIPFVGELIKVQEDSREWEPAIERLLHNFALRLIVPTLYYQQVNRYVNANDLKGRVIYHKVDLKEVKPLIFQQIDESILPYKLEFKNAQYTDWVKQEVYGKYDYLCTNDLEAFRMAPKALTTQGLIKNVSRHEKDDRRDDDKFGSVHCCSASAVPDPLSAPSPEPSSSEASASGAPSAWAPSGAPAVSSSTGSASSRTRRNSMRRFSSRPCSVNWYTRPMPSRSTLSR